MSVQKIVIVGGGPAGLMAAFELLQLQKKANANLATIKPFEIHLYDAMPSVGRKFLLAGIGGLNLTHSEPAEQFVSRYSNSEHLAQLQGNCPPQVKDWLSDFAAKQVCEWAQSLGVNTFVGSSGRVFPEEMKAAPLLRAWLHELRFPASGQAVFFHLRHQCVGFKEETMQLEFVDEQGALQTVHADKIIFAMGGASWPKLGSNGKWQIWLNPSKYSASPLEASNCGFDLQSPWTDFLSQKFAGSPLKSVALALPINTSEKYYKKGEFVITPQGVEGSLIYAASAYIRQLIQQQGSATVGIDLLPDFSFEKVLNALKQDRGSKSFAKHLKMRLGLDGVKAALLYEVLSKEQLQDMTVVANTIKNLPLVLAKARPIEEVISCAGGIHLHQLNSNLAAHHNPKLFFAGEMLDWDAPTGGYLLTACLASGKRVANGVFQSLLN
jgi:uncharacterized flavoprotein (TIGR03862 family)